MAATRRGGETAIPVVINGRQRYALHYQIGPGWALSLMEAAGLVGAALAVPRLVIDFDFKTLAFLIVDVVALLFIRTYLRGLADPRRNFVELSEDGLLVNVHSPLRPHRRRIAYEVVDKVEAKAKHVSSWPWISRGANHLDVRLQRSLTHLGTLLRFGKTLHLPVEHPGHFASELAERVARSQKR